MYDIRAVRCFFHGVFSRWCYFLGLAWCGYVGAETPVARLYFTNLDAVTWHFAVNETDEYWGFDAAPGEHSVSFADYDWLSWPAGSAALYSGPMEYGADYLIDGWAWSGLSSDHSWAFSMDAGGNFLGPFDLGPVVIPEPSVPLLSFLFLGMGLGWSVFGGGWIIRIVRAGLTRATGCDF